VRRLLLTLALALGAVATLFTVMAVSDRDAPSRLEVRVKGNQLVDGSGEALRLFGVNRAGTEYSCVIGGTQGAGIFSGPSDPASIAVMASWHINAVRVPLNEHCWLGINGVNPAYGGVHYQDAIAKYVRALNDANLIAILDLHWNAPGTILARSQRFMADADHAPTFWTSVATRFKDMPGVMFELYNEPNSISWDCWRSGCVTDGWRAVGMQALIDTVRATGAKQPLIATGLNHGNDLSGWLSAGLRDPFDQLVAGAHLYNTSEDGYCNNPDCWDQTFASVAGTVPVVTSELGEHDRRSDFIVGYMQWADREWRAKRSVSSIAWSWDAAQDEGAPSLIKAYDGTPTNYGLGFRDYLARLHERGQIRRP
jgi:endoglucanase